MRSTILHHHALLVGLFAFIAGCSGSLVSVSGHVTVGSQPLPNGQIEFSPVGGGGTPYGGPIVNGKYRVSMLPGEKTVVITETLDTPAPTSTEELQRLAAEGKTAPPPPVSQITPQTKGNSSQVTVTKETTGLDFKLEVK